MKIKSNENNPKKSSVILAAVTAGFILFAWGVVHRVLAARLAAPMGRNPIRSEVLERLPLQIGDWTGQDVPLSEEIILATNTDAHINRRYYKANASKSVMLYIACGVKARDLMPHRPEVCYTGAGWILTDKRTAELPLTDETTLPCNIMQFSRGSLSKEKVIVLDYYIVDGQYCEDVSLLRSKAWRGSGTVDYVAQVQIVTPVVEAFSADSARKVITDFAIESAMQITDLFNSTDENQQSDIEQSEVGNISRDVKNG